MFKTDKDTGIIEVPMISPHLELFVFSNKEMGLTEEMIKADPSMLDTMNFAFVVNHEGNGQNYPGAKARDLLKLIDGKRTRHEILATLEDKYTPLDVNMYLSHFAYNFVLISAEFDMPVEQAGLWTSMSISPRYIEQNLQKEFSVYCHDLSPHPDHLDAMKNAFKQYNIPIAKSLEESNLAIVLINDYMQEDLAEFNRQRLADKKAWIPVALSGAQIMYGPFFAPSKKSACLHCLTNNLKNNRETRSFLSYHHHGAMSSKVKANIPALTGARAIQVAHEIIRSHIYQSQKDKLYQGLKLLDEYLFTHDVMRHTLGEHFVNKRPQCPTCGEPALIDQNRDPKPVDLFASAPDSVFTSGGMKAVRPQQTLKKYAHLVSPITGVISAIERSMPVEDDWMHVYWSGSNLAIINRHFRALTNSLRSKSAGKGRSDEQARASAMCEALERYSGVYNGDEIRKPAKFSDFPKGDAMHPNKIMLYSDNQYKMRDEVSQKQYRFYYLPAEDFDENAEVEWAPMWSITRKKHVWLMCYQIYFSYDPSNVEYNRNFANPDSNGAASGNTLAEAFVQGFMELVERDAYAIWWYNRIRYPEVDIRSFNDPYLTTAVERYREKYNRDLWMIDITSDFGIPVFAAITRRIDKKKQDICISAGAHFDPHIAALRAVCEVNQYVSAVMTATDDPDSYIYHDRECKEWWQNATLERDYYLVPDKKAKVITKDDYPLVKRNLHEEVQACIDAVHSKGMEILVLDQTRPDVGLPVIKILVPGMRHFWARFAPGRLYDAPIAMGKLDRKLSEDELNPIPVFI